MAEKGRDERRTGTPDRRGSQMDRRQFIDIGWMMEDERRVTPRTADWVRKTGESKDRKQKRVIRWPVYFCDRHLKTETPNVKSRSLNPSAKR
ncbi:MAG: hypothetical protein RRA15_06360 [bacterium]|nr:hypothetical protein [bacterium]MDT8366098.1 hypothetical protein [bacterium]